MREPRLTLAMLTRLERLLDMLYKPGEIADELDISVETFMRSFVPAGAPLVRDQHGKVWINGRTFAAWAREYLASRKGHPRGKMLPGQGYCMRCKAVVEIQKLKRVPHYRNVDQISGLCPQCNGRIYRFGKRAE